MRFQATNLRLLKRTEPILGLVTVRGRRVLVYASPRGSQSASGEDKRASRSVTMRWKGINRSEEAEMPPWSFKIYNL
jgi:hypothetical protein